MSSSASNQPSGPAQVRLGLIQARCGSDPAENLARTLGFIEQAAQKGAQIICLQELFASLYFCQTEDHGHFSLAEPIPGPTSAALCAAARKNGVVLIGSLFERRAPGLHHNTAVVIDADGTLLGFYRKMHIPDDPLFYEKFYFAPGDLGFRAWETRFGRIGVCVCWDQWYPEAARLTALHGAQILFYPTAIGWHPAEKAEFGPRQHAAWETIQRSHAIANGCYVAAVNRVGHELAAHNTAGEGAARLKTDPGIEFWGQSFVADPGGEILARAGALEEEILIVPVDLDALARQRVHWPFLRDRRIDAYGDLTQRFMDASR